MGKAGWMDGLGRGFKGPCGKVGAKMLMRVGVKEMNDLCIRC